VRAKRVFVMAVTLSALTVSGRGAHSAEHPGGSQRKHAVERSGEPVALGIDVLEQEHFATLKTLVAQHAGRLRIGLVTDQAGIDSHGRRTLDILVQDAEREVPGLSVTRLFGPEHGISGTFDTTQIGDSRDAATGLPVVSLFGSTAAQRHPSSEQLQDLDAVLIDLQDAGVHFYTYETVVGYFLEAAGKAHIDVVILDRPNPITGLAGQGPVSTSGRENYINYISSPVRQGMTMGELGEYDNGENHLNARLTVVRMRGWRREEWYDQTGLMWINPSPNLRSLTEAILYPGIGMLERTNISVGRGTDTPFERIGAPWVDGRKLVAYLTGRHIPGVQFVPVEFVPGGKYPYSGLTCEGIEMFVSDRDRLNSPELGIEVASALLTLFPKQYKVDSVDTLILNESTVMALKSNVDPRRIAESWEPALQAYRVRRQKYLLY
jgi:uncharacterized protein YbbC (DUF1343 family)